MNKILGFLMIFVPFWVVCSIATAISSRYMKVSEAFFYTFVALGVVAILIISVFSGMSLMVSH